MFSRISQITRHLSPSFGQATQRSFLSKMASADQRNLRTINTAACLIIGDEVLGGKTVDTNSAYLAKWCFSLGIVCCCDSFSQRCANAVLQSLKRVEVIEDDESEIIEATRRMSERYDFVVTSGGIGPTHDDITYQSIAKAFNLPLKLHKEAFEKMRRMSKTSKQQPDFDWDTDSPALRAKLRMIELPTDDSRDMNKQFIFPHEDLWVPVAVVNGNVHILPGVPRLFEKLLDGLKPHVTPRLIDPEGKGTHRVLFSTPMSESAVAGYLTELAAKVGDRGIKVGSYPRWENKRNTVTLVGRDLAYMESLVPEVEKNINGKRVQTEGEDDTGDEAEAKP
ncbi:molybdenum cofactor synthesis domain-containing protein [Emericellopsis atlantica]|uniref:Molybdenum cofactor synthesis domain-containing protein n=1 Tax=Emericellopsis atlantica TaxID=2614577 RepID=A0A9P8CUC3_9HYPO|nr:molybdenum cofactor synthesis domain-containing protein [Emericellopsis atlantica]KAG9259062.1 molybdenum cofactor synthesis domain-containing protein [Emericellopsis atlantica]